MRSTGGEKMEEYKEKQPPTKITGLWLGSYDIRVQGRAYYSPVSETGFLCICFQEKVAGIWNLISSHRYYI